MPGPWRRTTHSSRPSPSGPPASARSGGSAIYRGFLLLAALTALFRAMVKSHVENRLLSGSNVLSFRIRREERLLGQVLTGVAVARDVPDHACDRSGVPLDQQPKRFDIAAENALDHFQFFDHTVRRTEVSFAPLYRQVPGKFHGIGRSPGTRIRETPRPRELTSRTSARIESYWCLLCPVSRFPAFVARLRGCRLKQSEIGGRK